jgi:hypothetical protein
MRRFDGLYVGRGFIKNHSQVPRPLWNDEANRAIP